MEWVSNSKVPYANVEYILGNKRRFYEKIREKTILEKGSKIGLKPILSSVSLRVRQNNQAELFAFFLNSSRNVRWTR
jgi:hypothetical protein